MMMTKIHPETDGFTQNFRTPEQETPVFGMPPLYLHGCMCPLLAPEGFGGFYSYSFFYNSSVPTEYERFNCK
jgi:hypothetical protein